jgi:hypothetical protein
MRTRALLISIALLAAACGGTSTTSTAPSGTEPPAASETTVAPAAGSDTTGAAEPEGPAAPNFSTILADGSDFVLADHGRPVYLVFWAEW